MSLKILIADDSMTAQNMGKKILADAGFDVVPVSNGAAAMKKIAETKPDIIVVDIFMPGYSGLEVCDKVKSAPETANVPVLLTVGKLEPYRAEEGAKVRAEGVIIKPFEASELLSAIAKIAEKYNLNVPQIEPVEIAAQEAPVESVAQEFAVTQDAPVEAAVASAAMPAFAESIHAPLQELHPPEVPSFIREASAAAAAPAPMYIMEDSDEAPAYNLDELLGAHTGRAHGYDVDEPISAAEIEVPPPEPPVPFSASSIPDPTATGSWHIGSSEHAAAPVEQVVASLVPEIPQVDPEFEPTAAEKVETQVESLMELESTPEGPVPVEEVVDPALVTDPDEMMKFTVKVGKDQEVEEATIDAFAQDASETSSVDALDAANDTSEFASMHHEGHSYLDDPMVQMGAIAIEDSSVQLPDFAHEAASEIGDDTMKLSLHSASGLEGALHEFEATEETAPTWHEQPETPASAWSPVASTEAHVEPELAPESVSSFVPETSYPTNVVAEMAAVSPEFAEAESEVIEIPEAAHYEAAASAFDTVTAEQKEESKTLAAAVGKDASLVARVVQKVFDRYREQMVADISDELSKGE